MKYFVVLGSTSVTPGNTSVAPGNTSVAPGLTRGPFSVTPGLTRGPFQIPVLSQNKMDSGFRRNDGVRGNYELY
jgi:hypothetical protein